jgi:hypothetical protein
LAFSFITLSSNGQVDPTTGNLINTGSAPTNTTSTWNNGVYVNQLCFYAGEPGNCGPNPSIRNGGIINFSYGTTDLNQVVNINRALAVGGTGVQLSGFNFGFMAKNGNGWDDGRQDYLAAYVRFYNASGGLAANYDYSNQTNQKYNWTNFQFSETFASPIAASNYSNAQVGFVGRDNNLWAGNYGPEIYNVSFSLKYRVDPCATNPAYSSTCTGFNDVINSKNLFNSSLGGGSLNQVFAINTALGLAGSGAMVHGLNYGFNYTVGQGFYGCTAWNQDGSCSWTMNNPAYVNASMSLRNSDNQVIHQKNYSFTQEGTSGSVSEKYLLPSSMNQTLLGTARLTASASGTGSSVSGAWANIIYTADPCVANPLSSPNCSGYGAAFAKQLTASNTASMTTTSPMLSPTGQVDQTNPQPEQTQQSPQQQSSPPPPDASQQTAVAQADPSQPAPTGAPGPAGAPAQTQATSSSSQQQSGGGAGPSKLAMSVLKASQEKDKATQSAAVQSAAKTLENATQSSQASSNLAISMNQDMSANSAVAAANFASQTTQASTQTAIQSTQSQQTVQASIQTQQATRAGTQMQQQQDSQQAQIQSTTIVQAQGSQQETQQVQTQSSSSVVTLLPPHQQEQTQVYAQTTANSMQVQQVYTPQQQDTQSTQLVMLKPPVLPEIEIQQQTNSGTGITLNRNLFAYNPITSSSSANVSMSSNQPTPMYQPKLDSAQYEVETPQYQMSSFSGVGKAGNPLSEIILQQRFELMQNNITQPASSVNKNVLPNELAGSIDIALIANVPNGFNAYSFVLKDASFYEPKEVYKNQRTVDNVRLLRGLTSGSDAKHQEMVNQQYK